MSERDLDIDFDFFEEEPPTQESSRTEPDTRRSGPRGPRRPPRAPQNLTPLLRLVGLIAFAILIIVLLVFWIKSCQAAGKSKTYRSYMNKVSEVATSSQEIGKRLSEALLAPGVKRAQLQQQIAGLARQEQLDVQRAQAITPPGPLRDEHAAVIQALQYRVSGLTGLARALGATSSTQNVTTAASVLAAQMQRPLASDVIWDDSFKAPAQSELKLQGITGTTVPDSNFLQDPALATTSAMTPVLEKLRGASTSTTGGVRGTSLISTKVLPSGQELGTSTTTTIVATVDMAFQVTVENSGTVQVTTVPVTFTIEQSKGSNIVKKATIDFLNPGEQKVITFRNFPQPNFSTPAMIKVEVTPVTGEVRTSNNSADYPVIFSVGA
ncbi:MAG TPA: hypothetical protein VLU96_01525 [Gaiellaceae bacterium]|nr:hypothetical protein [Gaiellaceae bacterium]